MFALAWSNSYTNGLTVHIGNLLMSCALYAYKNAENTGMSLLHNMIQFV